MNKKNTMKEEQKEEIKNEESLKNPIRQIIIETDGNNVNLVKAEVNGSIELIAILQKLIVFFNNSKQQNDS